MEPGDGGGNSTRFVGKKCQTLAVYAEDKVGRVPVYEIQGFQRLTVDFNTFSTPGSTRPFEYQLTASERVAFLFLFVQDSLPKVQTALDVRQSGAVGAEGKCGNAVVLFLLFTVQDHRVTADCIGRPRTVRARSP